WLLDGSYGVPVITTQRCRLIELHVTTETQSLVRSWAIGYADHSGRSRSLLASISERGHAADGTTLAAPVKTFTYSAMQPARMQPVTGWPSPMAAIDTDLVDLNGDGLPDILQLGAGLPTMHANLGDGRFGPPQRLARMPSPVRLSAGTVAFADMAGDGS